MQQIHTKLSDKFSWYRQWHEGGNASSVHWIAFVSLTIALTSLTLSNISNLDNVQNEAASIAATSAGPNNLNDLNTKVLKELKKIENGSSAERVVYMDNLRTLLNSRKSKILDRMARGDQNLKTHFISDEILARIPDEMKFLIEKKIALDGSLTALFVDTIDEADSYIHYELTADDGIEDKKYTVYFEKNKQPHVNGKVKASIKGIELDGKVFADSGSGGSTVQSAALAGDVTSTKSLLVILVNFTDNTAQPWTQADATNFIFNNPDSTNALIKEGSYNKVSLSGAVTPWYTINSTSGTSCDYATWATKAEQAATTGGFSPSSYNHVMYLLNGVPTSICNWGGKAYVGGRQSWINGVYANHGTKAHELGHNFGAYHSGFLTCGANQIAPNANCGFDSYGEKNAKMGSSNNFQFNSVNRSLFAWIPTNQLVTASSNGTYMLASDYSNSTVVPKILKIAKPDTLENYYITFKQAIGFNASLGSGNTRGASVYLKPNGTYATSTSDSMLLTMVPGAGYTDSALSDGGSFLDLANGLTVTQLSHTADTVTLSVSFGVAPCTLVNPTVSVSPSTQTTSAGKILTYTVSVTNKNNSTCGSTVYSITPSVPTGLTASPTSISLTSGASGNVSVPVASVVGTLDGSYIFSVSASNTANAGFSSSANATYVAYTPVVDTKSPTVSITNPLNGARVSGSFVNINISAVDNIRVTKVEILIDGKLVLTDTTSPYTYKWSLKKVTAGTHTIVAKAYDSALNTSSTTISVIK